NGMCAPKRSSRPMMSPPTPKKKRKKLPGVVSSSAIKTMPASNQAHQLKVSESTRGAPPARQPQTASSLIISPLAIDTAFEALRIGCATHVINPGLSLIHGTDRVFHDDAPCLIASRNRIHGHCAKVTVVYQVIESLRGLLFVEGIFVDHRAHGEEVVLEQAL